MFNAETAKVGMEHHFDLNTLKEKGVDVSRFIKATRWERYFSEPISVYPELVREFWKSPEVTTKEVKSRALDKT